MRKQIAIAGLMLASVFVGCQKDDIQDDIKNGEYRIESIEAISCASCKSNDNFTIKINNEVVTATFDRESPSQDDQGNFVMNRFYTVDTSFGADTFAVTLWFKGDDLDYADLHFYGPGGTAAGGGAILSIKTGGQENVVVGDYTASYDGKGEITQNTFFDQTGEIDLKWTINVTPLD